MSWYRAGLAFRAVLIGACVVLIASTAVAADPFDGVRAYIRQQLVARSVPSISVAVVKNGRIIWEEGFGWADREKRIPAGPQTMYSLASMSKPITATGLMVLTQSGKIDLDHPANDYLGAAKLNVRSGDERKSTVRTIANHSSGLPLHFQFFYSDEPWRRPSIDETVLRYGNLVTPPGERFLYSNLGYGVLGDIIARTSGASFAEFMRREVFIPLGMTHASVGIGPGLESFAASRYGVDGAPIPYYETDHPGASEIYGSVHDLALFALFHLKAHLADQKPILSDASIDAMHHGTSTLGPDKSYGVGFFDEQRNGRRLLWHSGGMGGVATLIQIFPDQGIATVALANAHDRLPLDVSDRIAAVMLANWPVAAIPPPPKPTPFVVTPTLAGTWSGTLATYTRDLPVELTIRPDAEVQARFGNQLTALVNHPRIEDGVFHGELRSSIGTPDTERFPYYVELSLNPGPGRLTGVATAINEDGPRVRNALSYWLELQRKP